MSRPIAFMLAGAALVTGCGHPTSDTTPPVKHDIPKDGKPMQQHDDMEAVRNDRIQFATMRPPGSTLPTRDRQVTVIAPPEAVALAQGGDPAVLDRLVPLLDDPARAWAAEVMLAALTGHEADIVNDYQSSPDTFFPDLGAGAKQRWQKWLDGVRDKLQWEASRRQFVVK